MNDTTHCSETHRYSKKRITQDDTREISEQNRISSLLVPSFQNPIVSHHLPYLFN